MDDNALDGPSTMDENRISRSPFAKGVHVDGIIKEYMPVQLLMIINVLQPNCFDESRSRFSIQTAFKRLVFKRTPTHKMIGSGDDG